MDEREREHSGRELVVVTMLVYLALLLLLTFLPVAGQDGEGALRVNLRPFASINPALRLGPDSFAFRQLLGNVIAFVPLGLLLPMLWSRAWLLVPFVGLALSAAIELGQLAVSLAVGYGYRSADVDDVILNTLGTLVGLGAFLLLSRLPKGGQYGPSGGTN